MAAVLIGFVAACRSGRAPSFTVTPVSSTGAAACSPARSHAAGDSTESIESGGLTRQYILHVPPGYDGTKPLPLVFNLHGAGSNASQQAFYSGFPKKADAEGFIVISPDGTGTPRQWNFLGLKSGADDAGFVRDLLNRAEAELCIDTGRVYATGISSGGAMSVSLACTLQDRITAVASVAALYYPPGCPTARAVSVLEFHGTADPVVPFKGGRVGGLPSPDVEQAAVAWGKADGCAPAPDQRQATENVRVETFGGCRDGASVQLYVIEGGGHTWPGGAVDVNVLGATTREISATDIIWQFFASAPALPR